jgi:hypothetical protein
MFKLSDTIDLYRRQELGSWIDDFLSLDQEKLERGLSRTDEIKWYSMKFACLEMLFETPCSVLEDARKSLRIPVKLESKYKVGTEKYSSLIVSLSIDGGAMRANHDHKIDEKIQLFLPILPKVLGMNKSILMPAQVVWKNRDEQALGFRYLNADLQNKRSISQFVHSAIRTQTKKINSTPTSTFLENYA